MDINISIHLPISPVLVLLWLAFFVNLLLAWRIWIGGKKNPINIYFALTVLMAAFWTLMLFIRVTLENPVLISLFLRLIYVFPLFIMFFFYLFTFYFPYAMRKLSKKRVFIILFCTLFMTFVTLTHGILISGKVYNDNLVRPHLDSFWFSVYGIYFFAFMAASFNNLREKYMRSDGIFKKRVKQVIIATLVAFVGGALFNLMLPYITNEYIFDGFIGPLFTLFMAGYIWYHIFLHKHPK